MAGDRRASRGIFGSKDTARGGEEDGVLDGLQRDVAVMEIGSESAVGVPEVAEYADRLSGR